MASGKVVQVIGPVVDVEFPPSELPNILSAIAIDRQAGSVAAVAVEGASKSVSMAITS